MLGLRMPSLTTAVSVAFLAYMAHSLLDLAKMWVPPSCEIGIATKECLKSRLEISPKLNLIFVLDTHPECRKNPKFVGSIQLASVHEEESRIQIPVTISDALKRNGSSLYLGIYSSSPSEDSPAKIHKGNWADVISKTETSFYVTSLVEYKIPEPETFNLLGGRDNNQNKKEANKNMDKPFTHLRSQIFINVMSDSIRFPRAEIPVEFYHMFRLSPASKTVYLPLVYVNDINLRIKDLLLINSTDTTTNVNIIYRPISYGKLRVFLHFSNAFESMKKLGFTNKDNDEIKGILTDTNVVLLGVTFVISAVHLVFDFLSFMNEISFWRNRKSMKGLSSSTVLWRAFSQFIIFLYLMNENTSLLVLIPSGISAIIELWKVTKSFRIQISFSGIKFGNEERSEDEKKTLDYDANAMKYLSYLLYPLVFGGAIYSLIYTPHKSWYSWTIQSTANGVYAFGFIFMLPQLFVNYKLKSVAHLPWKAFMYKAFNTFIDDAFAFIITMPTAHRVACFRDDVVFLVYLYQRYLYPIDSNRVDSSAFVDDELPSDKKTT